jgi:hypothetical protein
MQLGEHEDDAEANMDQTEETQGIDDASVDSEDDGHDDDGEEEQELDVDDDDEDEDENDQEDDEVITDDNDISGSVKPPSNSFI